MSEASQQGVRVYTAEEAIALLPDSDMVQVVLDCGKRLEGRPKPRPWVAAMLRGAAIISDPGVMSRSAGFGLTAKTVNSERFYVETRSDETKGGA